MSLLEYSDARNELMTAYRLWKNNQASASNPGWVSSKGNGPQKMNTITFATLNSLKNLWFPGRNVGNGHNIDDITYQSGEVKGIGSSLSGGKGSVHFKVRWGPARDTGFIWHFKVA
jgi:hypothetical protein